MFTYITWDADPVIFHLFDLGVRWYGLLFALSFVAGYLIIQRMFKKEGIPIQILDKLTIYMVVSTVIGARLGHCLFYEPETYLAHPVSILYIWEGGLASHGAGIGIIIGLGIFSRKTNKPFLWIFDRIAVVVALAGAFIRTGNLMNSEIFGNVTTLPWGFRFLRASNPLEQADPRHPTQIYEALSYLLIFFFLLIFYYRKDGKPRQGLLIGWFLVLVFGIRFLIEFIKEPQVDFERTMTLNMGQLLSIPFIVIGLLLIFLPARIMEKKAGDKS